jgi:hypothetical protein
MGGNLEAILAVQRAPPRITAAGRSPQQEVGDHALGIDAVVGMAIYTGAPILTLRCSVRLRRAHS